MSLWDVLKAYKGLPVRDTFAVLLAEKLKKKRGEQERLQQSLTKEKNNTQQ